MLKEIQQGRNRGYLIVIVLGSIAILVVIVFVIWLVRNQDTFALERNQEVQAMIDERLKEAKDHIGQLEQQVEVLHQEMEIVWQEVEESAREREKVHDAIESAESIDAINRILNKGFNRR